MRWSVSRPQCRFAVLCSFAAGDAPGLGFIATSWTRSQCRS
jgi:hypothetical protein